MEYMVQTGDTMRRIARRFGVSAEAILRANRHIGDANRIRVGDRLRIPSGVGASDPRGGGNSGDGFGRDSSIRPDERRLGRTSLSSRGGGTSRERGANGSAGRTAGSGGGFWDDVDGDRRNDWRRESGSENWGGRGGGGYDEEYDQPEFRDRNDENRRMRRERYENSDGDLSWLAVAYGEEQRGVGEWPGRENNPRIVEYHRATNLSAKFASVDETDWCSSFANWCLQEAGFSGTRSAWSRDFLQYGEPCEARAGAIVVFSRGGRKGHVGFYLEPDGNGGIVTLGGNQNNRVSIATMTLPVLGFRWPREGQEFQTFLQGRPELRRLIEARDPRELLGGDTIGRAVAPTKMTRLRRILGKLRS